MFKAIRKKPQKMNLKLQFQVTQIPPVGWEFLVVIVISMETGKNIWKSHKSSIQNGNCDWSDYFVESMKLFQQLKSQGYGDTLYKFVVSEGGSGSAILGDVTFDLVKYATAHAPLSVALPLQNCSSGTILHVKIQALTESKISSGVGWHTRKTINEGNDVFGSDDEQGFSDLSGKLSHISAGSELSQHLSGPLRLKSQNLKKDSKSSSFRYISDASDEEKPPRTIELSSLASKVFGDIPSLSSSFRKLQSIRQFGKDSSQSVSSSIETSITLEPALKSATTGSQNSRTSSDDISSHNMDQIESVKTSWDYFTGAAGDPSQEIFRTLAKIPRSLSMRKRNSFPEEPTFTKVINENHKIGESQEGWQAKRLGLEIEMLKQQLTEQLRQGADNDAKLLALFVEKDSLKAEVEKLKAEKQSLEDKENAEVDLRWEAEKSKQLIKELQEEVVYEKDKNMNLNVQLRKMQDSHVELVYAVGDLEKSLEEQRKEIEELLSKDSASISINKHEEQTAYDTEKQWMQKFVVQEKKIQSLEHTIRMYEDKEASKQGFGYESGLPDHSNEIIESLKIEIIRLNKDSEELTQENTDLIFKMNAIKKEVALKHESIEQLQSQMRETKSAQIFSHLNLGEVDRLKTLVSNLEEKLQESGDTHKFQSTNNESLLLDLQASLQDFQIENENLDNELKCSEACASSLLVDVEAAKGKCAVLENENRSLKSVVSHYEAQNGDNILQASQEEDDSSTKILLLSRRITELEAQLRHVREQRDAYRLERVESVLQEESKEYHSKLLELEAKKAEVMEECLAHKKAREHLESQLDHLKKEISGQVKLRVLIEQHTEALQGTLQELEGLLDKVKKDYLVSNTATVSLESELKHLQIAWDEKEKNFVEKLDLLLASKNELEQRAIVAEDSLKKMEMEKEAAVGNLQTELRQLRDQLELLLQSNAHLEKARLEEELVHMQEKIRQSETQAAVVTAQCHSIMQELSVEKDVLEERELKIAKELKDMVLQVDSYRSKEEGYKSQLGELEIKLAYLENDQQNFQKENEELKTKAFQLDLLKIEMDGLSSSLDSAMAAKSEVEFELQNLKTDYGRLESKKCRLENRVLSLEQSLKEMEELRITKKELEERVLKLQSELYEQGTARAAEAQQRVESMRLRRQNNDFKNKLLQHEVETEQFRHKMQLLEGELCQTVNALSEIEKKMQEREKSETGQIQETVELNNLRSKVKMLEDETQFKALELESTREEFKKKEFSLCQRIELLKKAHQDLEQRKEETNKIAELEHEITHLQTEYEALSQQDQEHVSKLQIAKGLESEVIRLQKANKQLENKLSQLMEEDTEERVNLENELAEALKEIKFYELQLQRELINKHNASKATSTAMHRTEEVSGLNEKISHLEEELKEMHNRYLSMSLKCAEVEAEREELFMTVRNLRNAKKL